MDADDLTSEQHPVIIRVFELLNERIHADPYAEDGRYAQEIRKLPPGLRAMAATHHLDVSLTLDDIGWHFLNFGEPALVAETECGLRELGLLEVAVMFAEAYKLVRPHLPDIQQAGDYYDVLERTGCTKRIDELTDKARAAIGVGGIYRHWIRYAEEHPSQVFDVH